MGGVGARQCAEWCMWSATICVNTDTSYRDKLHIGSWRWCLVPVIPDRGAPPPPPPPNYVDYRYLLLQCFYLSGDMHVDAPCYRYR